MKVQLDSPPPIDTTASIRAAQDRSHGLRLVGHLPALDGLRGLAIALVLLRHFTPQGQGHSAIGALVKAVAGIGNTGVDLFFVLSGFLITGILLDAKGSPHYFRNFYARRTLRIFPLYYAVLFTCFVLVPLVHPFSPQEQRVAHGQGWLWLYATNIRESMHDANYPFSGGWISMDHFWSLAVEEHFYLVWPLLVFLLNRRAMIGACLALIAGALTLRLGLYLRGNESMAFYHLTPCRMDELAIGGLLALLAREPHWAKWLPKAAIAILPASLLIVLMWRSELVECVFAGTLLGILFSALLVLVVTGGPRHPLKLLSDNRPMRFMGKYSYATYILHPLLLSTVLASISYPRLTALTHSGVLGVFLFLIIAFTISIGAAWLSWHLFEKHFLKLKRFFAEESTAARAFPA